MLTPLDVENVKFRSVLSGYDRGEVEQFKARIIQSVEDYIANLEALRARIGDLEDQLARYRENEDLLKNSVVLAQRTADELITAAHQRADSIVQAAQLEGASIRHSLASLRSEREQFEYAFYGLLRGFLQRLEQANPGLLGQPAAAAPAATLPPVETFRPSQPVSAAPQVPTAVWQPERERAADPVPAPFTSPSIPAPTAPPSPVLPERDLDAQLFAATLAGAQARPVADVAVETQPVSHKAADPALEEPFTRGVEQPSE